ncbi:MAG: M1 family metallopeptidase, partial [Bacteroidota bacterium]
MRLLLLFLALSVGLSAQAPATDANNNRQPYFQQDLSYDISARLDDERHELHAQLKLRYTNNSPDTLRSIPFHCWPRAFSSDGTAYARQALRNGNTEFHFSTARERGTLDSLNFSIDGQAATHTFSTEHPDIATVTLPTPLLPRQTITIQTPFRVKIPASFSRLGHVEQSYQMTQWYPKPAVYDRASWHAMPYLDQGEFYSEFGDFNVQLTLPANYVVGATGTLLEASEQAWLRSKANQDRAVLTKRTDLSTSYAIEAFPPSAPETKTITYTAEQVHDFAWFADKRFKVLHDTLQLNQADDPIDVWAMFTESEAAWWVKATQYLKRATRFYSEQVGPYPYPQVSGVQSALSAGGGMEYPMITVIGLSGSAQALDEVLAHEVGHNWFYGILGSNERDYAWMDEGLNSFYEQRYMATYWPDEPVGINVFGKQVDYNRLGYHYLARLGREQSPNTTSDSLSRLNYLVGAYSKGPLALRELEAYVGTARLDAALQAYYDNWKFKHPQPEDFFHAVENGLNQEVPFFREALMTNQTSDWALKKKAGGAEPFHHLAHRGARLAPASAQLKMNDGINLTETIDPQADKLPAPVATEQVSLLADNNPLDLYTHNNQRGDKPLSLSWITEQEHPNQRQLFAIPLLGFNEHDGILPGFALHNRTLEPRQFEWMVAPLIGTRSGQINGFAGLKVTQPNVDGKVARTTYKLGWQRFSDFTLIRTNEPYSYQRLAGAIDVAFRHAPITQVASRLSFQIIGLDQQRPSFSPEGEVSGTSSFFQTFLRAGYHRSRNRTINPQAFRINLEYKIIGTENAFNTNHLRLDAELRGGYQYESGRFLRWRAYGGVFLLNDLRDRATRSPSGFSLVDNARSDYRYDDLFIGRNLSGRNDQQLGATRQGGFRVPV